MHGVASELEFEEDRARSSNASLKTPKRPKKKAQLSDSSRTSRRIAAKAISVVLLVVGMIGACLAGFLSEESKKQEQFRNSVADLGRIYASKIQRQVRSSVNSIRALEAVIRVDNQNLTWDNFPAIAQTLIDTYGGISNLQLAPSGTVRKIHPLVAPGQDNRKAIGLAFLVHPNRRDGALNTIQRADTTVVGPLHLVQGGVAILAHHPIFSEFAPEYVPTQTWTSPTGETLTTDCGTEEKRRANCYFPGPDTEEGHPTHFWGFATMLTLVRDLLAPVELERLEQGGHRVGGVNRFAYQLYADPPHASMTNVMGIFSHSVGALPNGTALLDAVEVPVALPEYGIRFVLRLAPQEGWPATSSDFWVQVALTFPLILIVGTGMGFALLGNLRSTYVREQSLVQYRQYKMQQTILASVSNLDRFRFPMCLMSVEDFGTLGEFMPHEVMRDQGRLKYLEMAEVARELRDQDGVVFVSHQWVGFNHADPSGTQYRATVDAVQKLKDQGIPCRWIWVDFMCIPQFNQTQQQTAIDSLAVYVAHSSVFLAVAPSCQHADLDATMDLRSYNCRGWCRLEQLSYLAVSISCAAPPAFACTEEGLGPLWGDNAASSEEDALGVMEGNFTCCARGHPGGCPCDKTKVVGVMLGIYWRLLAWQRDLSEPCGRLGTILRQLEGNEDRFFPGTVSYSTEDGPDTTTEMFGGLVTGVRKLFEAESEVPFAERIQVAPPAELPSQPCTPASHTEAVSPQPPQLTLSREELAFRKDDPAGFYL